MNAKIFSKLKDKTLFSLEGRTALVTGAAQGIGLNIARGFAYAGCNVAMCDINMETATQQSELLNKELNSRKSIPIHIDVTKLADIERMIECTVKEYGRMDIAVNNAGIQSQHWLHTQQYPSTSVVEEDYDQQMDVNVKAVFRCCQQEGAYFISNQIEGRIINIGSISSLIANSRAVYNTTKAAVLHLTKSLAVEFAPHGILVNAICPGNTMTPMVCDNPGIAEKMPILGTVAPIQRLADPAEMIGAAIYLASDASTFTTGCGLTVTGGYECW